MPDNLGAAALEASRDGLILQTAESPVSCFGATTRKMEVMNIYELFRGEVAKQIKIINQQRAQQNQPEFTYNELAQKSGLTRSTVCAFMCGVRNSDRTAQAIAMAMNIEI